MYTSNNNNRSWTNQLVRINGNRQGDVPMYAVRECDPDTVALQLRYERYISWLASSSLCSKMYSKKVVVEAPKYRHIGRRVCMVSPIMYVIAVVTALL